MGRKPGDQHPHRLPTSADGRHRPNSHHCRVRHPPERSPGLALDWTGDLLVADAYDDSITEYSAAANGNVLRLSPHSGAATGLCVSIGIGVEPSGTWTCRIDSSGTEGVRLPGQWRPHPAGDKLRLGDRTGGTGPASGQRRPATTQVHSGPRQTRQDRLPLRPGVLRQRKWTVQPKPAAAQLARRRETASAPAGHSSRRPSASVSPRCRGRRQPTTAAAAPIANAPPGA